MPAPEDYRARSLPRLWSDRFVGRTREIAEVREQLIRGRLVCINGPPGIGKTRLAVRVTEDLETEGMFPDGIVFVPLDGVSDGAGLLAAIARAVGFRDRSEPA